MLVEGRGAKTPSPPLRGAAEGRRGGLPCPTANNSGRGAGRCGAERSGAGRGPPPPFFPVLHPPPPPSLPPPAAAAARPLPAPRARGTAAAAAGSMPAGAPACRRPQPRHGR